MRQDSVGQFYRDTGLTLNRIEALQICMTANGRVLAKSGRSGIDLAQTLKKWKALPDAERAPGAVNVPKPSAVDPKYVEVVPPPGSLILKVYMRAFIGEPEGKLRYVTGKDLWFDEQGNKTQEAEYKEGRTAAHEAQPHHMWLTEAEWKSLLPPKPKKGDKLPMPPNITSRILRWHLNPLRFYGRYGPDALDRSQMRSGELMLVVDTVADDLVRLRLEGFARLGQTPPAAVVEGKIASIDQWGYEPDVLGFIEYNSQQQICTRFDIVALGNHFGRLGLGRRAPSRIGLQPLGLAFRLIKGDQPADRVPPGRPSNSRSYFSLGN